MPSTNDGTEREPLLGSQFRAKPVVDAEAETEPSTTSPTTRTPLPWNQLSILLILSALQPISFDVIFPFINQMLVELGIAKDKKTVGFYSGLIESIFGLTTLVTVLPASYFSDRIGRKPVILVGFTGLAISSVMFGFGRSFTVLIISRCLGGSMGGAWANIKIMIGELTDKSNQNAAFSALMVAYKTGQVIGLPMGGFLSHPERQLAWTHLFEGQFWKAYPFALPCLVAAGLVFLAILWGTLFLRETLDHKHEHIQFETAIESSHLDEQAVEPVPQRIPPPEVKARPSLRETLDGPIVRLMISNLFMCLSGEMLIGVIPLFAFTPIELGGLSSTEAEIGTYLAIRAFIQIGTMTLFKYAMASPHLGNGSAVRLYKAGMFTWVISIPYFPLLNYLASMGRKSSLEHAGTWERVLGSQITFWVVMIIFLITMGFGGWCWICSSIMTNNAAPSREALATIAGVAQMAIILPQAIAPAAANSLFAYAIENRILNGNLVWVIFLIFNTIGAIQALSLEEPKHDWRTAPKRPIPSRSASQA